MSDPAGVYGALPCIRCGRCAPACPVALLPDRLHEAIETGREDASLARCVECRACTSVCPSRIDLLGDFRRARRELFAARARSAAAAKARERSDARTERLARQAATSVERRRQRLAQRRSWNQ
ncbi:MAG: 4Fe-4S dicluster domain-containing protein [Gammaproteobacteria bacterium]|nr:4Fe-4S dicluster domain-containing protein [Gammaproteobacteria bacterium]